jgi:subtilase family serine protease
VAEGNETNNCIASAASVVLGWPDFIETAVSNPPASAAPGAAFSVTDTVQNAGSATGGASTTRYYLSLDTSKDAGDLLLTGTRGVPSLASGANSTGTTSITVPATAPLATYWLLACADDLARVAEGDETNNCISSATSVVLGRPDLVETAVSNPPASAAPGTAFNVTDTVQNVGSATGGGSTTRYYLSLDANKDAGDVLLTGMRGVSSLAPGAMATGTASVTVPATTALGTYLVLACADDLAKIVETNEGNNCLATATSVVIAWPDLVEAAVGNPPANVAPGGVFTVTDTVLNQGQAAAGASTTRYYLSLDAIKDAGDTLLSATRSVGGLAPNATSPGSRSITVPAATPAGRYILLVCADDLGQVGESDNSNNCRASTDFMVGP